MPSIESTAPSTANVTTISSIKSISKEIAVISIQEQQQLKQIITPKEQESAQEQKVELPFPELETPKNKNPHVPQILVHSNDNEKTCNNDNNNNNNNNNNNTQQVEKIEITGKKKKETPRALKLFHLLSYIIVGGCDTLVTNYQNMTEVNNVKFQHPFIQVFVMFCGMSLPIYWVIYMKLRGKELVHRDPKKKDMTGYHYLIMLVPTFFDLIGSMSQYFAQMLVPSSVYQMMRGGSIVFTTILSRILFKRITLWYRYAGIAFVVIGLTLVGFSNILAKENDPSKNEDKNQSQMSTVAISYILLLVCMVFNACLYTSEELIYKRYNIHPCQLLGVESLYGIVIQSILILLLNRTECILPVKKNCAHVDDKYYNVSIELFFDQIFNDHVLFIFIILGIITKLVYGLNGVSTTHYFDSMVRSVAGTLRSLIVWGVGIFVTIYSVQKWEDLGFIVNIVKSIGFIGLLFGNLVYNNIIKLPYFQVEPPKNPLPIKDGSKEELNVLPLSSAQSTTTAATMKKILPQQETKIEMKEMLTLSAVLQKEKQKLEEEEEKQEKQQQQQDKDRANMKDNNVGDNFVVEIDKNVSQLQERAAQIQGTAQKGSLRKR